MPDVSSRVDIHIDLDKGLQPQPLHMMLAAGNANAHQLRLHPLRSGQPVDLSGVGVSGCCLRADGTTVPLTGHIDGSAAVLILSAACYAVPGAACISMNLTSGGVIATHVLATAMVGASATEIIVDPERIIPSLAELLARIEDMKQATAAANAAAAEAAAFGTDMNTLETMGGKDLLSGATWQAGTIDPATGADQTVSTRIKTGYIDVTGAGRIIFDVASGYKFSVHWFDAAGAILPGMNDAGKWQTGHVEYAAFGDAAQIRLLIANESDSAASLTYAEQLTATLLTKPVEALQRIEKAVQLDAADLAFTLGGLGSGGVEYDSNTRVRSRFIPVNRGATIRADGNFNCMNVTVYDENCQHRYSTNWASNVFEVQEAGYVRIAMRVAGDAEIAADDISDITASLRITPGVGRAVEDLQQAVDVFKRCMAAEHDVWED